MDDKQKKLYGEIVEKLAERSTCSRAHVGALILKDDRIVSTGYNGSLPGEVHCDDVDHLLIDHHCIRTVHAEMNALLFCAKNGTSTKGCDIFITHSPCAICTKLLIMAGIRKVYYLIKYRIESNPFLRLIETEHVTYIKDYAYDGEIWTQSIKE